MTGGTQGALPEDAARLPRGSPRAAMDDAASEARRLGGAFLASLDKAHLGAAASRLVAASVGEIVTVFCRSPAHRHYSLADIEWMVLPAVAAGQFYVVEAAHREQGFRAPIAVATWAFVSEEVDRRLRGDLSRPIRLRPDEWKSGEIGWIVDLVGAPTGMRQALTWLREGPFKERKAKLVAGAGTGTGRARVETLDSLAIGARAEGAA
jgi:hemolysin-activating ACP:hemolysin acyltransferase